MSAYWIYKCNSKPHEHQRAWGDWADVFATTAAGAWGTTEFVPELAKANIGDTILAYQTDRNELVGVARVVGWQRYDKYKRLILKPVRTIGVRVRPLKEASSKVALIPALKPGRIQTLYEISRNDANVLLKAARDHLELGVDKTETSAEQALKGAGFGTYDQNKKVEKAALSHVKRHLKAQGWDVRDVSSENRGYDLSCENSGEELHVEVKGARGDGQQFIITRKELNAWKRDSRFVLAFCRYCSFCQTVAFFFSKSRDTKRIFV